MSYKSNFEYDYEIPDIKLDKKYLYDVKIIKDDEDLKREIGKVNFKLLSKKELCYLFSVSQNKYKRYEYFDNQIKCDDVINTISEILKVNRDAKIECLIEKILNKYIKEITYIDYNSYQYYFRNEHPHPSQDNIDHNKVGQYYVIFSKEIPKELFNNLKKLLKSLTLPNTVDYNTSKITEILEKN